MKQCHFRQHKNFGKHSSKNVFSDNSIPTECDIWILDTIDYTINGLFHSVFILLTVRKASKA